MKKLKVLELFAGVGGFRLGLESTKGYKIVWSNQWEPATKTQHASKVYEARFGSKNHSNHDISEVPTSDIPDADILVGGFPCQDYSVATSLQNSKGLIGKKGVLWWSIHRILSEKKNPPKYLFLENVDRLLKSPSTQRGRDFAIMLKSLDEIGYAVEWRVINAAEYGMPQRRRRIFFLAYHKSTRLFDLLNESNKTDWILKSGVIAKSFSVKKDIKTPKMIEIEPDLVEISNNFNINGNNSPFENSGVFINGKAYTTKTYPKYKGEHMTLGDVLQGGEIEDEFYIPHEDYSKWEYHKSAKKEVRTSKSGYQYTYSEGSMKFPDLLDKASRTIITGEGGKSPSRFKHVINTSKGLRRLTPLELERLNMFPDNHTKLENISVAKRAFFMGNALVVGVVEKIGKTLYDKIHET
ncbi:DNA (cytosine-5-)-methyltransferase [Aurantibacter sp.]|uniref:DNA (cytosine-5-)-methyltransferase n=1 Tax=Aurantibacter sp. TaxID=2807103 RepID=UPI003264EFA7